MKLSKFYADTYISAYTQTLEKATCRDIKRIVNHLIDSCGDRKIKDYKPLQHTYCNDLVAAGMSKQNAHKHCRWLNTILKRAGKSWQFDYPDILPKSPKIITDTDFLALYRAFDSETDYPKYLPETLRPEYWHAILIVASTTAIRRQAILGIEWRDIDYSNMLLHIRPENDKKRKLRTKPITEAVINAIEKIRNQQSQNKVFLWKHYDQVWYKIWNAAEKRAGVSVGLHDIKRYSALLAIRAGADELTLTQHMDHSDIGTTLRHYITPPTRKMVDNIELPSGIFSPPSFSSPQIFKIYQN
jgi:integrase